MSRLATESLAGLLQVSLMTASLTGQIQAEPDYSKLSLTTAGMV
jgi:hypothetical protein